MPPLSITASQVVPSATAKVGLYTAGAAITAGQAVYVTTGRTVGLADCDAGSGAQNCIGIAINSAPGVGQPVSVLESGVITLGAAAGPVNGVPYFLAPSAGGICILGEVLTGDIVVYIGVGIGSNQVAVRIHVTAATVQ
jgi:hypothetical protein